MSYAHFVACNNSDVKGAQTRGAYNVLLDIVMALSSDLDLHTVKYTLLNEVDLDH